MRHLHPFFTLVAALVALSGCPTRDKYDRMPTVRITSPTVETYTNGSVNITARIDPPLDLPIVLRRDGGAALATLTSPSYTFVWNTTGIAEGLHTIVAEVEFSNGIARSDPITIVVDRTPPSVTRTPAPGAANVAVRAPIQAAFSEPVVLSQSPDATFSLSIVGGSTVATHATIDALARTATLSIDDPTAIPFPTSLLATIAAPITDRAGNPLVLPADDWFWEVPEYLKLPPLPVCSGMPLVATRLPAVAMGAALKPVVVWASSTGLSPAGQAQCQLAVSAYADGQWNRLRPPSDDPDSAHWGAALALDANDRPIIAWRPPAVPDPGEVDVASWSGTAWNALGPILPMPGVDFAAAYPVLRVARDGNPVLLSGAGLEADRYFIARATPSGWNQAYGTIPIANQTPFDGPHFDMILDGSDNPILAWVVPSGTGHGSTWNGTAWSAPSEVSGMANMTEPFMALDQAGLPLVAVGGFGTFTVLSLYGANSRQPILTPPGGVPPQARHPRIAAGPDGSPILAWFDPQTTAVGMGRWVGQRWVSHEPFFGANANDEPPQVVVDRYGTAWVGWRDATGQFNLWMLND